MMANKVTCTMIGEKELVAKLKQLSDEVASQNLVTAVQAGADVIQNAAKQKSPKKTRTLSRSIHQEVLESSKERAVVEIGTDLSYAKIHEYGGVIAPKKGRFLAIPVSDTAKTSVSPRNFPGKLHVRVNGGSGVLLDADNIVHFALVTSVTIPARPYLRPALDENKSRAISAIGNAITLLMEKVCK